MIENAIGSLIGAFLGLKLYEWYNEPNKGLEERLRVLEWQSMKCKMKSRHGKECNEPD